MALLAVACSAPADLTVADRVRIADEVRAAVDTFAQAERDLDVDELIATLAPDFYMYGDGVRADYASVVEQLRATIPSLERFDTTWSNVEVTVLSANYALVSMTFEDAIVAADGQVTRARGPNTFIWRRDESRWRLVYVDADHYPVS